MTSLEVKQGDTFTVWTGLLSDENGWIDLSSASSIKMVGKIQNGATLLGPVVVTATAKQSFTANLTSGSSTLQSVSAFTNLAEGSTLTGAGIPPLTLIGSVDTTGNTISMVDVNGNAVQATKTATTESLTGNQGMTTYTPLTADTATTGVFSVEFGVHWTSGLQIVPNQASANPTLTIDPALDPGSE